MWRYGEKLIRHLFKKRTEGQPIRVVLESKIQADREAIFECLRLGYPLNDMEITSKARELQRKRLKGNA